MERLCELKAELQRWVGPDGEAAGRDCALGDDVAEAAVAALRDLKDCHVSTDLLLRTQLGKLVKKISKQCTHFLVKRAALDTLDVWKAVVSAEAASSPAPAPAPSPAPAADAAKRPNGDGGEGGARKEREKEKGREGEKGVTSEGTKEKRKNPGTEGSSNPDSSERAKGEDRTKKRNSGKEGGRVQGSGGDENGSGSQADGGGASLEGTKGPKTETNSGHRNGGESDGNGKAGESREEGAAVETKLVVGEVEVCGDTTRDRLRSLACDALCLAGTELEGWEMEQARQLDVAELAVKVEKELWNRFGSTKDLKEYKAKWRSLHFNLKNPQNPDLRRRVVMGLIEPAVLVVMTPEEMASDTQKEERERVKKQKMEETVRGNNTQASTDQFRCGKCGQRKTTYFQMQTRSADEPMTTFVSCLNCNNRWKFC